MPVYPNGMYWVTSVASWNSAGPPLDAFCPPTRVELLRSEPCDGGDVAPEPTSLSLIRAKHALQSGPLLSKD